MIVSRMRDECDVVVIGAGQAGSPLARRFAADGRKTLLIEREHVGGTCINRGCTPTKTMVASARAAHVARTGATLGVEIENMRVNLDTVIDRKDEIVLAWRRKQRAALELVEDLTLVDGEARFVDEREIAVDGRRYRGRIVVVNVGARPSVPSITGLDRVPWMDSTGLLDLRTLPDHLVVLGGGYIGCEFGQMFRRFGSDVTIVNRGPHLIGREDEDVATTLEDVFREEGIELRLGADVTGVRPLSDGGEAFELELANERPVRGSHLLVAVGRTPNTDALDCDVARIQLDDRGFVRVDDSYRTSADGVFAVGDVTGGPQFTHTSWDDHRILYELLSGNSRRRRSGRIVPYCVFTDPQVARVGLSEEAARARGVEYEVATMPFGEIARAVELGEPRGMLKVLIDPRSEQILGAAIVGVEAGELIHIFVALMSAGVSARGFVNAQAIHPTLAEGVQSLLMRLPRYALD